MPDVKKPNPNVIKPLLLSPLTIRDVTFSNCTAVAPMCQCSATDGTPNDWHMVHLGGLAKGGFGAVMTDATAILPEGRITHGDLGVDGYDLWPKQYGWRLEPREPGIAALGGAKT